MDDDVRELETGLPEESILEVIGEEPEDDGTGIPKEETEEEDEDENEVEYDIYEDYDE